MNTRLTAALVGAGAFVIRFLRLGAIENDHYVYLARAHQVLHGDWPVRDFADPGMPFGYLLSALAAAVAGPTLLTEAVLSIALFAIGVAVMFVLVRRASGSAIAGFIAVALVLFVPPRLYNSSKMLVPLVAMALAWTYADRSTPGRIAALGVWTGVAFLFRHDYAVYIGGAAVALLLIRHWGEWRLLATRALVYGATAFVIVAPWLAYVHVQQGLPEYLASAMRFSAAEGQRTITRWAPIYYVMAAVPVVALVAGTWRARRLSRSQVLFAALLVLFADLVLLRDDPGSRLPDVYATTLVLVAVIVGALKREEAARARVTLTVFGTVIALGLIALLISLTGLLPPRWNPVDRWRLVATRLREARPDIMPVPERAVVVDYLARCTAPDERVLVGGFAPELPVLARRPFAGGMPDWIRGYYDHSDDVARARAQLARERVAVAVMIDGGDGFSASWPALAADLRARDMTRYYLQLPSGRVELWIRPTAGRDTTGLPCRK